MEILFFALVLGLLPGAIARSKGRSFVAFWIFGAALFIVALPWALLMSDTSPVCPFCKEKIKAGATICPHCRRDL